jgi:hypothetical protein
MPVCDGGIGPARLNRPLLYVDEHPHRCPMKRSTERPLLGSVRCIGDWLVQAEHGQFAPSIGPIRNPYSLKGALAISRSTAPVGAWRYCMDALASPAHPEPICTAPSPRRAICVASRTRTIEGKTNDLPDRQHWMRPPYNRGRTPRALHGRVRVPQLVPPVRSSVRLAHIELSGG